MLSPLELERKSWRTSVALRRAWTMLVALAVVSVLVPVSAHAQVTTADIVGSAADTSGAVLPGVTVTVVNLDTSATQSTTTALDGLFQVRLLPPGRYRVTLELEGFSPSVHEVSLAIGDRFRLDAKLGVGGLEESLTVIAETPILQSQTGTVAALVGKRAMEDLPLNGRNFVRLAQITPGVTEGAPNSLSSGTRPVDRRQTSSIQINGQDTQANNFLIDGLDNNERFAGTVIVRPSVDAIQEMRVETSVFSAELGRTIGGVINIITRSGTNDFHGSAFEFYRHESLDARNTFAVGPKPRYRQNQFGGSVGGPLVRNRTFFFADYSGLRQEQGQTYVSTVPTAKMRAGDFSEISATIYDPLTGQPFPGNVIPPDRLDPAALALAALYPLPQRGGLSNNFSYSPPRTQDEDSFDVRVDHRLNDRNNLFGRVSYNNTTTYFPDALPEVDGIVPGGGASFPGPAEQKPLGAQGNVSRIISPTMVMEAKFGYAHYDAATLTPNSGIDAADQLGIPGVNYDLDSSGLPIVTIAGFTTLGDAGFIPVVNDNKVYQAITNATYSNGAHSLKAGFSFVHRNVLTFQSNAARGSFAFNANFTSRAGAANTGNGMASFLLGYPASTSRNKYLVQPHYLYEEYGAFLQYDWRVTPWLSVNAGLRYDYFTPTREADNQISNVDLEAGRIVIAGQDTTASAGVRPDRNDWSPRVSFAASVNTSTVVRGGYGIVSAPAIIQTPGAFRNPPFVSLTSITPSTFTPVNRLSQGLPPLEPASVTNPTGSLFPVDFGFTTPWAHQYNVAVQRQLPGAMAVTIGFVGVLARDLAVSLPLNTPLPAPGAINPRRPFAKVFPGVQTAFTMLTNAGSSNYRSVQALFERRFANGWGGRFQYTWSHGRTTTPASQQTYSQIPAVENPYPEMLEFLQFETYDSNQDVRHRATFSANYEIGLARNATGLAGVLARGWQVNLVGVIQSGTPFTVTNATSRSNTGAADRPNQVCDATLPGGERTTDRWFDTSCFVAQPVNTFGDAGVNTLRGPGLMAFDLSVFKNFVPVTGTQLQFRVEAFNVFNRPNYANPASALGAASFGKISSTGPNLPRNLQLAVKFLF